MFSQSRINGLLVICTSILASGCAQLQMNPIAPASDSGSIQQTSEPVPSVPDTVSGALMLGSKDAPVTMLLFTNYDCAYCNDVETQLMPRLQTDFIATGKVKVEIVTVPLQKYPASDRKAHILLCGVRSGSGAAIHTQLFAGQTNFPALKTCLEDDAYLQSMMAAQYAVIRDLDVSLVPTYFLNEEKFTGLPDYADLRGQIEKALKL